MPNNKVKSLSKVKHADKAHPYSRRAKQMRRAIHRDTKLEALKDAKDIERRRKVERILFFKFIFPDDAKTSTILEMHDYIEMYLNRNEDEIEQLRSQHRKGRPNSLKLEKFEMIQSQDLAEYESGFEMPDLTITSNVERLRKFEGDFNGISLIKMITISSRDKSKHEQELNQTAE